MLTLYHGISSVCSVKVRVGLAELGLAYEDRVLDLQKGEQFAPDYLALNPAGVVPTLIDGDLTVVESSLILEYLDRSYNGSALMPKTPAEEASARHWLLRCLGIHGAVNTLTFSTVMRAKIRASKTQAEIEASVAAMPDPVLRHKRLELLNNGLNSIYTDQALGVFRRTFADMQAALDTAPWMGGGALGITDIALVAYIDRLERLGFAGLWEQDTPAVGTWLSAMQARPSYAAEVQSRIPAKAAEEMRREGDTHYPAVAAAWAESA